MHAKNIGVGWGQISLNFLKRRWNVPKFLKGHNYHTNCGSIIKVKSMLEIISWCFSLEKVLHSIFPLGLTEAWNIKGLLFISKIVQWKTEHLHMHTPWDLISIRTGHYAVYPQYFYQNFFTKNFQTEEYSPQKIIQ